jgi:spore maturation protein CgeB
MRELGWCPSGRLFEAAACGAPLVSDCWDGLDHFFRPNCEILLAQSADDVIAALQMRDADLSDIAQAARQRVLREHTAAQRACEFEQILENTRTKEMAAA